MATISRDFEVHLEDDRVVRVSVDEPGDGPVDSPTVVFIPGFKGFKDWGGWPWFCRELAAAGHRVARINPSMCGVGAGLDVFDEPERFARQTLAHDVEDVVTLLQHPELSDSRTLLLGHSRGGLVAALTANSCSGVDGVITMGTPDQLLRLTEEEINQWFESGVREIVNARTGETLVQDRVVLEDFMKQGDRYNAPLALSKAQVPVLSIHGDSDPAVECSSSLRLLEGVEERYATRILIEGAGHTFGLVHPFAGPHAHAQQVIEVICHWIEEEFSA
ncbi:MAG: alpha/beta hydrolase [Planctomycetota bacterium]|nr:alpha/beta hydrolase [Planctomycetota bacterium]